MILNRFNNLKKKLAFTLVELVIVIAIISLLAAVVIVAINPNSIFINGRNSTRSSDLNTLLNAFNRYIAESPITSTRALSDFPGYLVLYTNATAPNPTGNCPGGISGTGLSALTTNFTFDSTGTANIINLTLLVNNGYLPKVPKDPSDGSNYSACIDTSNNNSLIVYASKTESLATYALISASTNLTVAPTNMSSLALWLRADSLSALTSGTSVATWTDSSISVNNVTQATGGSQPTYMINGGGKSVVRFNGTSSCMNITTPINSQIYNVFMVVQPLATPTTYTMFGGDFASFAYELRPRPYIERGNNLGIGNATTSLSTTQLSNISVSYSSPLYSFRYNTASDGSGSVATSFTVNKYIGCLSANSRYSNIDLAEMLVFTRVLSTSEVTNVEQYLKAKWNTP